MSDDRPMMIITCTCGQKMRVPADSPGKVYKCVKCGAHVRVRLPGAKPVPPGESHETSHMDFAAEPVGQLLCEAGVISREELMEALARQRARGGKTFDVLIGMGALTADQLHDFLSRQPGIATIDLARFQVDRKLLEIIPKRMAQESLVLPIDQLGKLLTVAMACPLDTATIHEIETVTSLKVKAVLCRLGDINDAVQKYYPDPEEDNHDSALRRFMEEEQGPAREDTGPKIAKIETLGILPQSAKRLATLGDDDSALLDTAAIAETDPLFAATLLRTANSAAYGMAGRVDSVAMAVTILDKDGAIAASRLGAGAAISDPRIEPFLRRACRCAAGAAALARITNRAGMGAAYTAGLLHEMGCFALAMASPQKFFEIAPELTGEDRVRMERKYFTSSHIEAGASLAARWRLPDNLCLAIRHVLTPLKAGKARDLAAMVSLAAVAAANPNQLIPALFGGCDDAIRHLALDMSQLIQTLDAAMKEA